MKNETKRMIRIMGALMFIIYLCVLTYLLFFAEMYGRTMVPYEYRYNLVPFQEIRRFWNNRELLGDMAVFTNLGGNVLACIKQTLPGIFPDFTAQF